MAKSQSSTAMHFSHRKHTRSPPSSGGITTRAATGLPNDTAQPSLTSGFGAVIAKERELMAATTNHLGEANRNRLIPIERMLRHHQSLLGANIALLEQRYEALPHPVRLQSLNPKYSPLAIAKRPEGKELIAALPDLIARHTSLVEDIGHLIARAPDGQRGELILTEVGRNHEDMAWMLTALVQEEETGARHEKLPAATTGATWKAQEIWDNEGGPPTLNPTAI